MNRISTVQDIRDSGLFSPIDLVFAAFVSSRLPVPEGAPEKTVLFLAAALASCLMQRGHSCCDLARISGGNFAEKEDEKELILPEYDLFMRTLKLASEHGLAALVPDQNPGASPLVADSCGRLYLNRYYNYELKIAEELVRRSNLTRNMDSDWSALPELPPGKLAGLSKRFEGKTALDYQQAAVFLAHSRNFTIITGGPGTGKTTVLTALLAWEIEENPQIRIELCAPTGKAQNRMKESIAAELKNNLLNCSNEVKAKLAELHCQTVDSLLHPILHTPNFRRNRNNPIAADLVVLDEVSMSSLSQLGHLFDALKLETRLILIGDKDQLSPVEAGAVLGDLVASGTGNVMPPALAQHFERQTGWKFPSAEDSLPLSGCIAELKINYRAKDAPEICTIADQMRELNRCPDNASRLAEHIQTRSHAEFAFRDFGTDKKKFAAAVRDFLIPAREMVRETEKGSWAGLDNAFRILDSFRILCAVRQGFYGVENLNLMAENFLDMRSEFSVGMPLIVLENTPALKLFNGDVGLVWQNKEDAGMLEPETVVMFRTVLPSGTPGYRMVKLPEMPPHEAVFAMTIHKSQGSGFEQVMIVMPPKNVPILSRELLYTAITRAERSVLLCSDKDILLKSLKNKTIRYSGLPDRLKEKNHNES
ncbi:MAG: exodeoxyribonuclease V subunit alpha [Lentisphaeria bacterium]|nr:exodeoxyribonuclease V subunit alpha [Lentisphaeria bacterium]